MTGERPTVSAPARPRERVAPRTSRDGREGRNAPPERPDLSASDVEWWAESALNATFEPSRVVAIEDAMDPNDPSYGDRITPVFLESITPVFPESKVREVMALADAVEKARADAAPPVPPAIVNAPVPPAVPAPPVPPGGGAFSSGASGVSGPPAVTTHAVRMIEQAPPSSKSSRLTTPHARPVAPPLPASSRSFTPPAAKARPAFEIPAAPAPAPAPIVPAATLAVPAARTAVPVPAQSQSMPRLPSLPHIFEEEASDDELHAVSLASAGAHVTLAIWIAIVLILIMVAATMATVG